MNAIQKQHSRSDRASVGRRVAVIGTGISGLVAAYCLKNGLNSKLEADAGCEPCDVHVFESNERIGGHTATIDVEMDGRHYAIDTGFIVYNDWTYPNFIRLLEKLGVESQPTAMGFSVSCEKTGLEYAGNNYNTLFAQRRNIFRPAYLSMLKDIVRFNKESVADVESGKLDPTMTLGEYLATNRYSAWFIDKYLVPMGAAIWSSGTGAMDSFPLVFFVRFFKNHGLLSIKDRPQWRTLVGGSRSYLGPLTESFSDDIRCNASIVSVKRKQDGDVAIAMKDGRVENFSAVVFATHSDQALNLLEHPTEHERSILGAMPYTDNSVVLHYDTSLLPTRKRCWSSWNYRLTGDASDITEAKLTYDMNILQNIQSDKTFCVSLNQTENIDRKKIIGEYCYSHPEFSVDGMEAQQRWHEIAGQNNRWYCGAYWRNGFHEDGVYSALRVVDSMREHWQQTMPLSRADEPNVER